MSSQAFYRKWRPQTLAEVVGQKPVTQTLLNALKHGRVSHAYLFCGPRGTGKTSTGRILAKSVNCLTSGKGEPCNTCPICQSITEGRSLDVIEIDAASNRGIDDIRELRERVGYSPSEARRKVYIIDEVHMLSKDASNALLKTLEEPPPHVIFVLATTEVHKVLPTILSRCQRFDFRRISQADVVGRLAHICREEGITTEPEALRLIARSATGSLRDATNLLEQLTTYYGNQVGLAEVQNMLGITGDRRVRELVKHMVNNDLGAGIATITSLNGEGVDLSQFHRELMEYLRGLLLVKTGSGEALDWTQEDIAELKELAGHTTLSQVVKTVKLFGGVEIDTGSYSTLPLELALVDSLLNEGRKEAPAPLQARTAPEADPAPATQPRPVKAEAVPAPPAESKPPEKPAEPVPPAVATAELGSELERLTRNWRQVVEQAPEDTRRTMAVPILRSAGIRPSAVEGDIVVLSFKHDLLREKAEKPENLAACEKIISNFLGRSCRVRCIHEPESNHLVRAALKKGAQIINVEGK